jgi:putative phage-type endonuclease
MATLILGGDAPREEWLAARRQGVTASEVAVIMGLVPGTWNSPLALYLTKRGEIPEDDSDNEAMALGRYLEDYVCQRFADRHPEFILQGTGRELYASENDPQMLATPDRIVREETYQAWTEPVAVLEAKTSNDTAEWGDDGTDEIPVRYRCQVLWQMSVMGLTTAYVACLFLHARHVRVYEITMNADAEHDLVILRAAAEAFLERVRDGRPPAVDWLQATTRALKSLHPGLEDVDVAVPAYLARQYRAAHAAAEKADQRKKLAENLIRARLGTGRRVTDPSGNVIAVRQKYDVPGRIIERKAFTVDKLVLRKEG